MLNKCLLNQSVAAACIIMNERRPRASFFYARGRRVTMARPLINYISRWLGQKERPRDAEVERPRSIVPMPISSCWSASRCLHGKKIALFCHHNDDIIWIDWCAHRVKWNWLTFITVNELLDDFFVLIWALRSIWLNICNIIDRYGILTLFLRPKTDGFLRFCSSLCH